jgi:hypothetical protein
MALRDTQRKGMEQEISHTQSSFELKEQTRQMMKQRMQEVLNDPDPERQLQGIKLLKGFAIESGDTDMFNSLTSYEQNFKPGSSYREQSEAHNRGVAKDNLDMEETRVGIDKTRADTDYIRAGKPGSGGGGKPSYGLIDTKGASSFLSKFGQKLKDREFEVGVSNFRQVRNNILNEAKTMGKGDIDVNALEGELYAAFADATHSGWGKGKFNLEIWDRKAENIRIDFLSRGGNSRETNTISIEDARIAYDNFVSQYEEYPGGMAKWLMDNGVELAD